MYVVRRERNVFTGGSLSVHRREVYPSPRFFPWYLVPGLSKGYTSLRFFPWSLVPGPFWGYPRDDRGAPELGLGVPLLAGTGLPRPPPPPETEQQSDYLLRSRRYASCGQARGLSCFVDTVILVILTQKAFGIFHQQKC